MEAECKRLGWVMVPCDAGEPLSKAIANSFSTLQTAITLKQLVVHTSLLDLIERLEAALIEKLCELATSFRDTRSDSLTKYEKAKTEKEKAPAPSKKK